MQPGNPHRLVLRQHVYPKASIARFVDAKGGVDLLDLERRRIRRAKPDDAMLCADRAWNDGAETGWMKRIEDAFQALIEPIISNPAVTLEPSEEKVARDFYALWQARAERRSLPVQYVELKGVLAPATRHTADELEILEKNGYGVVRGDCTLAYRELNTAGISIRVGQLRKELEREPWGVVIVSDAEFCIPDTPANGIVPISPSIALVRNCPSGRVTPSNVGEINRAMLKRATTYVFARSLPACPGIDGAVRSLGIMGWSAAGS